MPRRSVPATALSFLDTLSNGFGAIVLLYIIFATRAATTDNSLGGLKDEAAQLRTQVTAATTELASLQRGADASASASSELEQENAKLQQALAQARQQLSEQNRAASARDSNIGELEAKLRALDEQKRLAAARADAPARLMRKTSGDGQRQYLTGLRVGGKRILILVDRSASMLDETLVNVIRSRNLPRAERLRAPKWRRTVATVDWLTAQLPADASFQIYAFNTTAEPVLPEGPGWLPASERKLDEAVRRLGDTLPEGGTSLHAAMKVVKQLSPPPDNVYLLVDGLPTQGEKKPTSATVDAKQRLDFFRQATREVPEGTALNVILFPMEGDPAAAPEYWWLSQLTGGAFLVPSRDWP